MPDTAPSTELPTCIRHAKRYGNPWCSSCATDIYDAIGSLPTLHGRLLDTDGLATRAKLIGGPSSIDPASPSPEFDLADEIATTLRDWAQAWREHLGEQPIPANARQAPLGALPLLPCCAEESLPGADSNPGLHSPYCPWRRYLEERARHDAEDLALPESHSPRASATYLRRHRRHADLLASPLAEDLGREMLHMHGAALAALGGDETSPDPVYSEVPGLCPDCGGKALQRAVDLTYDVVECRMRGCELRLDYDEYAAILEHQMQPAGIRAA